MFCVVFCISGFRCKLIMLSLKCVLARLTSSVRKEWGTELNRTEKLYKHPSAAKQEETCDWCLMGTTGVPRKGVWTTVNVRVWTCKQFRAKHDRAWTTSCRWLFQRWNKQEQTENLQTIAECYVKVNIWIRNMLHRWPGNPHPNDDNNNHLNNCID